METEEETTRASQAVTNQTTKQGVDVQKQRKGKAPR